MLLLKVMVVLIVIAFVVIVPLVLSSAKPRKYIPKIPMPPEKNKDNS